MLMENSKIVDEGINSVTPFIDASHPHKKSTFPTSQGQQNKHDLDLKRNYTVV